MTYALAFVLLVWAGVLAYIGWRWSIVRLAEATARKVEAETQKIVAQVSQDPASLSHSQRIFDQLERATLLLERVSLLFNRFAPVPAAPPLRGDNITAVEFGKRKPGEQPTDQPPTGAA